MLIFGLIITFGIVGYYFISTERLKKKVFEIERILDKTYDNNKLCEQYALVALKAGWFPCLRCGGRDSIYLYEGRFGNMEKTAMVSLDVILMVCLIKNCFSDNKLSELKKNA